MPTTDINDVAKPIRDVWENIKTDFFSAMPGYFLQLTCVYRSPEEQFELFKKGREESSVTETGWRTVDKSKVVTNVDGKVVVGAHNYKPSRAIDVAVVNNQTGRITWEDQAYAALGPIADRYGLVWGGSWKSIKDLPHVEVKDYKNYREA